MDDDKDFWRHMAELDDAAAKAGGYVVPSYTIDPVERKRRDEMTREFIAAERDLRNTGNRWQSLKCVCGERATLTYRDMPIWADGFVITIKNAPGYICTTCGEGMMLGSDSMRMTELARIAMDAGLSEIEFGE